MTLRSIWLGIVFTAAGCVSHGYDFPSKLDWIEKQATSQDDVKLVLGRPMAVGSSGGTPTWTYGFYRYRLFGGTRYKELKLYWDDEKVVKHYSFSSSFPGDIKAETQH